jgi:hypothetical protein
MPSTSDHNLIKDKKQYDSWRARRPQCSPIPDRLWKLAVAHVKEHGLNIVSHEFRVNYSKLKEKLLELERNTLGADLNSLRLTAH